MRVLVYCPLASRQPRLYAKVLTALFELDWPEPYELLYGVSKDTPDAILDQAGKLERARQIAIRDGFDALFIVAYDVQVPTDALRRLVEIETDIVFGIDVYAAWPYEWQEDSHFNCTLIRRAALESMTFLDTNWDAYTSATVTDLYCSRLTLDDGGKVLTPDSAEPDGVRIHYLNPQRAPVTVPYSRTILAGEPA